MTADIGEHYLLATTAKEIWESAMATYSNTDNTATIYQLKRQLHLLTQGDGSVTTYYTALIKLWQQLDLYEVHQWPSTEAAVYYKSLVDQERCYKFLLGLNDSFEDVRGRIMSLKPIPTLMEAFNTIKFEESRKVLLAPISLPSSSSTSAFASWGVSDASPGDFRTRKKCDYCHKNGHTKAECWKLNGKPPHLKTPGQQAPTPSKSLSVSSASSAASHSSSASQPSAVSSLSPEELLVLRKILDNHTSSNASNPSASSISLARAGTLLTFNTDHSPSPLWIIDSEATNHITGFKDLYSNFSSYSDHAKVEVANGKFATVCGSSSIIISPSITLHNVLYVPEIECSLLSVPSITSHLNCQVTFTHDSYNFQDLTSGKMIGITRV